jgi:hypothetical protein
MAAVMRALAAGAVLTCAAIGLAGTASADPALGNYTGTVLQSETFEEGADAPFTMNACGPDCIHVAQTDGWDLHRQGALWTEKDAETTVTLDEGSLLLTLDGTNGSHTVIKLVKNA